MAVVGHVFVEQLVDGFQQAGEIIEGKGIAAAQVGLKIGHEKSRGNSLPRNVGEHKREMPRGSIKGPSRSPVEPLRRAEIEEVVIVAADLAGLEAAADVVERIELRKHLREETRLDFTRDLDFVSGTTILFQAIGHQFGETHIFERDGSLARDRVEQIFVFTRVGLL